MDKVTAWCVFSRTEIILLWSCRPTRSESIKATQKNFEISWGQLKKEGYTCKRVTVKQLTGGE